MIRARVADYHCYNELIQTVCNREKSMAMSLLDKHIETTPGIVGGKPRISGRRITVQNIAVWHERIGMSADEIAAEYDISLADVFAALTYYFDYRSEIDEAIRKDWDFTEDMRNRSESRLGWKLATRHAP